MPRPDVVDDVLWGQVYKMTGQLSNHLMDFNPKIIADDHKHLIRLGIIADKDKLPEKMVVEGPPAEMAEHVEQFKKSHKRAKFSIKKSGKGKKIYAEVKRPVTRLKNAISKFFKEFSKAPSHLACSEELVIIEKT
jgi:tRNA nucleotidyltransferase (CCA-adding enzyme)